MEVEYSEDAWLEKPLEPGIEGLAVGVLNREVLVELLASQEVEASFVIILLNEANLLFLQVLELSLVVVFAAIHYLEHRVLLPIRKHHLLVVVGHHQFEVWVQVLQVVQGHHAIKLLPVVLGIGLLSNFELLVKVKHHDLLNLVPLAGHVASVAVVAISLGRDDVAMVDRMVESLVDVLYFTDVKLHVHNEHFGAAPSN